MSNATQERTTRKRKAQDATPTESSPPPAKRTRSQRAAAAAATTTTITTTTTTTTITTTATATAKPAPAVRVGPLAARRRAWEKKGAPASTANVDILADLQAYGLDEAAVNAAMTTQEPRTDCAAQWEFGVARPGRRADQYLHLRRGGTGNWVLFESARGWPAKLANPPALFKRYAHYQPGNKRVLEINLKTDALRLRSTPGWLMGKKVVYDPAGPTVVDATPA